jgi:hypothetical protein
LKSDLTLVTAPRICAEANKVTKVHKVHEVTEVHLVLMDSTAKKVHEVFLAKPVTQVQWAA